VIPEKAILARVLFSDDWNTVMDRKVTEDLFQDAECRRCFRYIVDFYAKYTKVPSLEIVEEAFPELKLSYAKEPAEYYLDKMTENYVRAQGARLLMNGAKILVMKPLEGLAELQAGIADLTVDVVPTRDDSIAGTIDVRKERYLRLKNVGGMDGHPTPWGVLNEATMGLHAGDFVAIVSRPGVGKTFMLTILAEYLCSAKLKVLFVSNEMSNGQIMQRFDAVHFKLPYKELRAGLLPDALEKRYFEGLAKMKSEVQMDVTQDVKGILSVANKIDLYRPDIVLIDGMYLLSDDGRSTSRWESISNISRGLKKLAQSKKIPVIATTQFNRAADEVKMDKVTLSNLGFSDSIGQDADVVLGLFRTRDMEMNNEMRVRMLKIREGEPKDFTLHWDLRRMEFGVLVTSDDDSFLPEDIEDKILRF